MNILAKIFVGSVIVATLIFAGCADDSDEPDESYARSDLSNTCRLLAPDDGCGMDTPYLCEQDGVCYSSLAFCRQESTCD